MIKQKVSELEDSSIEIIQSEQQRIRLSKTSKMKGDSGTFGKNNQRSIINVTGVPEGKEGIRC